MSPRASYSDDNEYVTVVGNKEPSPKHRVYHMVSELAP